MCNHHSSARKPAILATSIAAALLAVLPARSATLTWDTNPLLAGPGDGAITGGAGTWTTSAGVGEWTADGGLNNVGWNNANLDQAVFGGIAGAVTLGTPISANALTFNTTGYSLAGNTLTLGGATPAITAGAGIAATISSVLTGTAGVTVTGGGTVTLLNVQDTYTGGTTVTGASTLTLTGTNSPTGIIRGALTINAGSTVNTTTPNATGYGAGVSVNTLNINGGTLNNTAVGDQLWAVAINLNAGTLRSNGGTSAIGTTQLFSLGGGSVVNSLANAASSVIAGRINLRETNVNDQLTFDVADGTAAVDLLVSAAISANATSRGIVKNGAGTIQFSGQGSYQGNLDINAGTVIASRALALGANNGTRQITLNNAGTLMNWTINNVLVGAGSNAAILPTINLNSGTTLSSTQYNAIGNLNLNGATLSQSATGAGAFRGYQFLGTVTVGGTTPSVISSTTGNANHLRGSATITFDVEDVTTSPAADLTISTPIANGSGDYGGAATAASLQKIGLGTLTLTAANTYTGSTTIGGGTLVLGSAATLASANIIVGNGGVFDVTALPASTFTVAAGQTLSPGSTLGFTNDVLGSVIGGTGTISVAGAGTAGTFTLGGNLTLNGGTMAFDLASTNTVGGGVNDLATVGDLTLSGLTSIAINKLTGSVASSTYTLINYTGALTGNAANFTLGGAAGGITRQTFALDTTTTPGSVLLNVAGTSASLVWAGDGAANAWDINTTVNWTGATDGNNRYFDGDIVAITDSGNNATPIAVGVTVRPALLTVSNPTKDFTIAGAGTIAGGTGLVKDGSAKLTLGTTNSFTGPVAINAGTVSVATLANSGVNSGLGAGSAITLGDVANVGTLQYTGATVGTNRPIALGDAGGRLDVTTPGAVVTATGGITGNGPFTKLGDGALTMSSLIATSSSVTVDGGTLTLLNTQHAYPGGTTVNNGGTLTLSGANSPIGVIRGTLTVNAGGTVNTTTANALGYGAGVHVDNLILNGGLLNTTAGGDQGWNIAINMTAGTLQSNGGVSDLAAASYFSLGGNSSVNSLADANSSTISGRIILREGNPGNQLAFNVDDGAAAIDLNVTAAISGNAATRGIVKNGAGTMVLGGAMSYTGTTSINAGTLALGVASSIASPLIAVAASATFDVSATPGFVIPVGTTVNVAEGGLLQGTAEVGTGGILIAGRTAGFATDVAGALANSGSIRIAGNGTAGTLTLSDALTLNDGGTVNFDLANDTTAGSGMNDLIATAGSLTLAGTTTLAVNQTAGTLANGSYTLFTYAGALTGGAANLALGGLPATSRRTFAVDTASTAGSVLLTVAGATANLIWTGDGAGNPWDLSTTIWNNGGSADKYYDLDSVTFDNSGSDTPNVAINTIVQPGAITLNNSTKDYTFSGTGAIAGATGLTKNGSRKLTIATTNSFTGAVAINEGTVSVATVANGGVNSPLGAGTAISLGDAATAGTLQYTGGTAGTNRPIALGDGGGAIEVTTVGATLTAGGVISGAGAFTKSGNGNLVLSNAGSDFTGNITVDGGTLTAPGLSAGFTGNLGIVNLPGRSIVVNPTATLAFTANNIFGNGVGNTDIPAIVLNGSTLTSTRYNAIGNITLNGATLTQSASDAGGYEGYQFVGNITVGGSAPSIIATTNGKANHLGPNTTFDVANVTANGAPDLIISAPLREQSGDFGNAAGALTKTGAGTMTINGAQSYTALNHDDGRTNLNTSLANATITGNGGTLVVNADATNSIVNVNDTNSTYFTASQTLAELNIADGGYAEISSVPPPESAIGGAAFAGEDGLAGGVAAVPEPGSLGLLLLGAAALLGRRRRPV